MVLLNVHVFKRVETIKYFIEKALTDLRLRQDLGLTRVSPFKVVQSLSENEVVIIGYCFKNTAHALLIVLKSPTNQSITS